MPDNNTQNIDETLIKNLAEDIIQGNVILILGHESLLRIPDNVETKKDEILKECQGNMEKWMFHQYISYKEQRGTNYSPKYNTFDSLYYECGQGNINDDIREIIYRGYDEKINMTVRKKPIFLVWYWKIL